MMYEKKRIKTVIFSNRGTSINDPDPDLSAPGYTYSCSPDTLGVRV